MKIFHINKLIHHILDVPAITNILGGSKIYPLVGKFQAKTQTFELPAIVYMRQETIIDYNKDLYRLPYSVYMQLDIVTKKYEDGLNLADNVYYLLNTANNSYNIDNINFNVHNVVVTSVSESTVDINTFVQTINFTIKVS